MNIFYLSHDPVEAATMQCDKHVVKMILESAQMMSDAHRCLDDYQGQDLYKALRTHRNHPSTKWTRETSSNYEWHWKHLEGLCKEYTRRYGKIHKTEHSGILSRLKTPPRNIPLGPLTPIPCCMPDEYKVEDPVESYRLFYKLDKVRFAKWKNENYPEWWLKIA